MGTESMGPIVRVEHPSPHVVVVVYELGRVVKQYSTAMKAMYAYEGWKKLAR